MPRKRNPEALRIEKDYKSKSKRRGSPPPKPKPKPATAKPRPTHFVSEEDGFENATYSVGGFKTNKEKDANIADRRRRRRESARGGKAKGKEEKTQLSSGSAIVPRSGPVSPTGSQQTVTSSGRGAGAKSGKPAKKLTAAQKKRKREAASAARNR